jgi:hypothetical protein
VLCRNSSRAAMAWGLTYLVTLARQNCHLIPEAAPVKNRYELRLVKSNNSARDSRNQKLRSVKCEMLPAGSFASLSIIPKVRRLHALHPEALDVIEKLVNDILDDIEGRRP